MRPTIVSISLGLIAGFAALVVAHRLGAGHGGGASDAPLFVLAGVLAGALLHVPAHVIMSVVELAANGVEGRIRRIGQGGSPATNEDLLRAGRRSALRGLRVVIKHFASTARANPSDHDLRVLRRFAKAALGWIARQQAATRRRDRPEDGAWTKLGLCFEAVHRDVEADDDGARSTWDRLDALAWQEFAHAMEAAGVQIPRAFRAYFHGEPHCWLGWRRAGHLFFMEELKHNHEAFVGYIVEMFGRREGPRGPRPRPLTPAPSEPPQGEGGAAAGDLARLSAKRDRGRRPLADGDRGWSFGGRR